MALLSLKAPVKFGTTATKEFPKFNVMKPSKGKTFEGEVATISTSFSDYPDTDSKGKLRNTHSKARVQIPDHVLDSAPSVMAAITQEILDLLDRDDSESAITLTQKHLLRTVIMMLPEAERMIRASKSARGVHNFSQLINSCREIMADIQMARDNQYLATNVNVRVIQPGMINITNNLINTFSLLKAEVSQYVPADKKVLVTMAMDNATKAIAKNCESEYRNMAEKVDSALA